MTDSLRCYADTTDYRGELRHQTFRDLVDAHAGNTDVYIRYYDTDEACRDTVTFAQWTDRSRALARLLADRHGIRQGDRVVVVGGNAPSTLLAYTGCLYLGAVVVPVDPRENREFVTFAVTDCAARLVLFETLPDWADALGVPVEGFADGIVGDAEQSTGAPPFNAAEPGPDWQSPATIVYTSGTTGRSKGVIQPHGSWLINAEALRRHHAMDVDHVHMCVLPVYHVNAFGFSFVGCLYSGARLILNRTLNPLTYLPIVKAEGVTLLSLVPGIIRTLCGLRRRPLPAGEYPSIRYATSGAAPLPKDLARDFITKFGVRIVQGYGMSEGTNFNLLTEVGLSDDAYETIMLGQERTSAGTPLFGTEVVVLREDGDTPCGAGEPGEICMRGWPIMHGYNNFPDGTAQALRGGWLRSGDIAIWKQFGDRRYFYISGRKKDIVKRHGESLSLIDIDERLQRIAGLEECAAVGFPNTYAGEEIGLVVVRGEDTPDLDAIDALCREVFADFRRPRAFLFIDAIPRTSTGKIKRAQMADWFADKANLSL